ncbi:MAG: inositol monophosphatase [Chloroflexi bacterium]|nr:inositol monophosphatase [Chloroflexota bacterium]
MTVQQGVPVPSSKSGRSLQVVMEEVATAAADLIRSAYGRHGQHRVKGPKELVTEVDSESERLIAARLAAEFPGVGFLGEETGRSKGDSPFDWVVDPLDGTRNFVSGIPLFCVSIGLVLKGTPIAGVLLDVVHRDLFSAAPGIGLQLNGKQVKCSQAAGLDSCVAGYDLSRDSRKAAVMFEMLERIEPSTQSIRGLGSTALGMAYAACGKLDLYLSWGAPWDVAAGLALAMEGGATVTDRSGRPAKVDSGGFVVGAPAAHGELMRLTAGLAFRTQG